MLMGLIYSFSTS